MERTLLVTEAGGVSLEVRVKVWSQAFSTMACPYPPAVAEHLIAQHSAIKMLHSRVKLILEYVKASEAGRGRLPGILLSWSSDNIHINAVTFCAFRRGPL